MTWNHYAHLEAYLAIPVIGGVLHILNLQLAPDELGYIINDAEDRVLIVDDVLSPIFERIKDRARIESVIVVPFAEKSTQHGYQDYDQFLQHNDADPEYADLDEDDAVSMCYTSGNNRHAKGSCLFALHSYSISLPDNFSISRNYTILPAMSMFPANAWGLSYAAIMNGSKLVLPGPNLQPDLMLDHRAASQFFRLGSSRFPVGTARSILSRSIKSLWWFTNRFALIKRTLVNLRNEL